MTTVEFIAANRNGDIRNLALQQKRWPEVDMPFALDQIAGWQKARTKIPTWAATDGLTYPPRLSMEQCSSELTARYKAKVAGRLLPNGAADSIFDLTGGFGVDFSFLSRGFAKATYVERNSHLCTISSGNFRLLGLQNVATVCGDAVEQLSSIDHASLIFLDPARRDSHGGRTIAIGDCTPDVSALWPALLAKSDFTMLKLSPMLDIDKALCDLGGHVSEVHIVAVGGECKELLLVGCAQHEGEPAIHCVNIKNTDEIGEFCFQHGETASVPLLSEDLTECQSKSLCQPDATIMKAGCFGQVAEQFSLCAIAPNSHLFIADEPPTGFPGRCFRIQATTTMNRRELKTALNGITQANIAVRNFPLSADALRAKLKLKDGGITYLFATTDRQNRHILLITE